MKDKLLEVIGEIISLLKSCNLEDKARWFQERADQIKISERGTKDYLVELEKVRKVIAGMGSFSDLPMYPKKDSNISEEEASQRQWDLAARLGDLIEEELEKCGH